LANVIPFPAIRRSAFIARAVATASTYSPDAAANYLRAVLDQHENRLRRLGVDESLISKDVDALDGALQAGLACAYLEGAA
jgi:hypothetical protein